MNLILALILWLSTPGNFTNVPEFKGGQRGLNLFIARNMLYPEYAKQNCLQGTVNIRFKLTKKGEIFGSKVQKGFGVDLDIEALRIVRLTSGLWKVPAAFDTTQSIVIPINFALKEYNCNERSAEDIRDAIVAYKAKQDLTKAVINFYDKKSGGSYSAEDEARILELKQQLGYDDRFFDRTIRQAQQKLRQGDKESACEDFNLVRKLGSDKADQILAEHCQ
ncbi:TonB family protein [Paradesertivirga mongoliensis]|uniref:TonB family protein n=1 Tax=Paradesertivirga mongoliensis TaxID=2100740 RepID=A0ABW4ZHD6_9SPHI|nr:TonB family protein [Pedobacter mongoliensis]